MKWLLACLILFIANPFLDAQRDTAVIHIRLIDGRTGRPMKVRNVVLEDRAGYRDISVRPDPSGVATLRIDREAVVLTHNTHEYVDCGDERGGLVHNDYKVSEIVSTGLVEPIEQPNLCAKSAGELVLFVRPWRPGEDM